MNTLHWDVKELKNDMKQLAFQVSQIKDNQTKILEEVTKLRRRTSGSDKPHRNVSNWLHKHLQTNKTSLLKKNIQLMQMLTVKPLENLKFSNLNSSAVILLSSIWLSQIMLIWSKITNVFTILYNQEMENIKSNLFNDNLSHFIYFNS